MYSIIGMVALLDGRKYDLVAVQRRTFGGGISISNIAKGQWT